MEDMFSRELAKQRHKVALELAGKIQILEKQRDDLLKACQKTANIPSHNYREYSLRVVEAVKFAKAAIKAAKG